MSGVPTKRGELQSLAEHLALVVHASRRGTAGIAVLAVRIQPPSGSEMLELSSLDRLDAHARDRIASCLSPTDALAKVRTLQYVALLLRLEEGAFAMRTADAMVGAIRQPFSTRGGASRLVASVGVSVFPEDGESLDELLPCAEAALEAAEMSGGDLFGFYSGSLSEAAGRRIAIERALTDAVERQQFTLHYQPQLDARDGSLRGVEALLRWKHHAFGAVSPVEFVPVLENLGLIGRAGNWVLHEACRQVAEWSSPDCPLRVGVNVSAHQVRSKGFAAEVRAALQAAQLDPRQLELELTESVLLEDEQHVRETLSGLRRDGVRVALDDFGTGYASLAYIRQFPMDTLKIDRQFVRGLPVDAQNAAITSAIVALGQSLQLEVVAEGIEEEAEEEFLHSLHCFIVQGFRYAKPMPPDEFVQWRKARPWT